MSLHTRRWSVALLAALIVLSTLVGATGTAAAQTRITGSPDLSLVAPENRLVAGSESVVEVFVVNTGTVTDDGPEELSLIHI